MARKWRYFRNQDCDKVFRKSRRLKAIRIPLAVSTEG
jgi:hypothetical protein